MPQNPFKVEIRLADSEEIQTDFEVKQPDGSISHVHYDPYGLERQREARKQQKDATVNCHIKCDWQWFSRNYVRLSLPQYLRLGEKIQETGLLVSLTGWL